MVLISGSVLAAVICSSLLGALIGSGWTTIRHTQSDLKEIKEQLSIVKANITAEQLKIETQLGAVKKSLEKQELEERTTAAPPHPPSGPILTFDFQKYSRADYKPDDLPTGYSRVKPSVIVKIKKASRKNNNKNDNTKKEMKKSLHRSRRSAPWEEPVQDKKLLTELVDDASIDTVNHTRFESRVLESGVIIPNLGIVMEQTGTYMEYSGYIYIPIIYHMPHLAPISLIGSGVHCNISTNVDHQRMIVALLKDKIGTLIPKHSGARKKRFIETVILGGAVAWNRASIWSLQDNVASLEAQLKTMRDNNQIVTSSMNTLIDNQHAVHHAVDRQARILKEFMEKSTCDEIVTNYFREVYATWLSLAPNDFSRVVDGALSGRITPDLLPATDVVTVLLKHPAIAATAYTRDLTLLYELGRLSLHQVNYDPYPMVSGVMIFPRILTDRSAALMRVHTTHTKTVSGYRKLKLPDMMACKSRKDCWGIPVAACREMMTLTLCPKTTKVEFNACVRHIVDDSLPASNCEWRLSTDAKLEVVPFDGGVLVSASNESGEIMITQGKELVVHSQVEPSDHPIVLTADTGDYLHMGGQIYQLSQETVRTGYDIIINSTIPLQREDLTGVTVDGWVDESHVPALKDQPWSPPDHYTWWVLIGSLGIILVLIGIMVKYRLVLRHLHRRVKDEISGWVAIPSAPSQPPPAYSARGAMSRLPRQADIVV